MVGLDGKVVEEFVVAKVNSHQPLLTALLHNAMPTQNSLLLLRLCALPRLNFLCRTISPRLTSSGCTLFDQMITDTFRSKLQLPPLSPGALTQVRLPLRHGGFGLRSALASAPAAYLGSLALAAIPINSISSLHPPSTYAHSIPASIASSYRSLPLDNFDLKLSQPLPPAPEFINFFATHDTKLSSKLQKKLTQHAELAAFNTFRNQASKPLKAHLTSLNQRSASLWLTTIPTRPELILHDTAFRLCCMLRLDLALTRPLPSH